MDIGLCFNICSLFFLLFVCILFFSKKRIENIETKIYGYLLLVSVFIIVVGIACFYAVKYNTIFPTISFIVSKAYLLLLLLWALIFTYYVLIISSKKQLNKITKKIIQFSFILFSIVITILPIHYYVDAGYIYTFGKSVDFLYFIVAVQYIIWILYILINLERIKNKKYIPVIGMILLGSIVTILQKNYPELRLMTATIALITFSMYHTIENPDVKMIRQLDQAKLSAEKANHAKSDFLSSMSHEIRTPLNAIVGFSDCILEETTLEAAKNDAKDIKLASENLLEIVNGILDISKIEADKMEIVETDYNPVEILENVSKLIKPRIAEKPIEMLTSFAPDLPYMLHGDGGKIRQIITNILTNAVKYTEEGRITFNVNCVNEGEYSKLVISVEDTGRGIKPEQIDKLFNKFQRLDEDKNTTLEGTGLGLAITKKFVEMMGGRIIVQSKYGEGSKFTVYIKQKIVILDNNEKNIIDETNNINNTYKSIDFTTKKVLLVDDNKINLRVATKLLSNFGINADSVESGFECLDKINNGVDYDLILLDDMMPKMSGVETLVKLKNIPEFNTPVVALTANAISGMREQYLSQGFNDYLSKPIEKDELLRVLNEYLK